MLAKIAVMVGVGLGLGLGATDAQAATLSVRVSPVSLHPGSRYTVTITGTYAGRRRAPYLLGFIQYGGQACQPTATAEYSLPTTEWSWDFYPQRAETASPFKSVAYWKAGSRLGNRRVCAYLYAHPVTQSTTAPPIIWASASFRDTQR